MTETLQNIVEKARMLSLAEQQELRAQLDLLMPHAPSASAERDYRHRLLSSGSLSRIPPASPVPRIERPPIQVNGKPVSETILEERR